MNSLRQKPASHSSLIPRLLAQCSAPTKHSINTCWFSEQALVCASAPKEHVYSPSSKTSSWFMRNPPPLWCCSWDLVCFLLQFCWWVSRTFSPVFTGSSSLSLNLSNGEPAVTGLDFSLKEGLLFMFSSTKFEKAHKWLWRAWLCTLTSALICRTACVFLICVALTWSSSGLSGTCDPFGVLLFQILPVPRSSMVPKCFVKQSWMLPGIVSSTTYENCLLLMGWGKKKKDNTKKEMRTKKGEIVFLKFVPLTTVCELRRGRDWLIGFSPEPHKTLGAE